LRGIPAGYVNNLQRRLAETERALLFALREIYDGATVEADYDSQPPDQLMPAFAALNDAPTTRQQKARQELRWRQTPLGNRAQAKAWLDSVRRCPHTIGGGEDQGPAELPLAAGGLSSEASGDSAGFATQHENDSVARSHISQHGNAVQRSSINSSPYKRRRTLGDVKVPRPVEVSSREGTSAAQQPILNAAEPGKASIFANANPSIYF
jgi:hypothetical protein